MQNPWKLTSLVLTAALAASVAGPVRAEPQPLMKDALVHLRAAQQSLVAATADKGGHRAKAIVLVRNAIVQVERGIAYDDSH